jgi:hypothetical protein
VQLLAQNLASWHTRWETQDGVVLVGGPQRTVVPRWPVVVSVLAAYDRICDARGREFLGQYSPIGAPHGRGHEALGVDVDFDARWSDRHVREVLGGVRLDAVIVALSLPERIVVLLVVPASAIDAPPSLEAALDRPSRRLPIAPPHDDDDRRVNVVLAQRIVRVLEDASLEPSPHTTSLRRLW